jgi:hypothetical protein
MKNIIAECDRSHTRKTKTGKTYEKFLGQTDYDQKVLLPFKGFLHASFCKYFKSNDCNINLLYLYVATQDCAGRSLVKAEEAVEEMASET